MTSKFRFFIPFAVAITGVTLIAFGLAQQLNRQAAYDPQIQISEDVAGALDSGIQPQTIIGSRKIDVSKSLSTFIIIFDKDGKPTTSSGILNGNIPTPPNGVFEFTSTNGQDRLTWQPADDVRIATIITKYNNGFVLAGRNMREVEHRIQTLTKKVIFGWLVTLVGTLIAVLIFIPDSKRKK